jgi:hypothetical protein
MTAGGGRLEISTGRSSIGPRAPGSVETPGGGKLGSSPGGGSDVDEKD